MPHLHDKQKLDKQKRVKTENSNKPCGLSEPLLLSWLAPPEQRHYAGCTYVLSRVFKTNIGLMLSSFEANGICNPIISHKWNKKSQTNYATFHALITLIWLDYHRTNH